MSYEKLLSYTLRLLSHRSYSTFEIKTKLALKTEDESVIDQVIDYLNKQKFLNDYEFARSFVKSKLSKAKGSYLIKYELKRKGISDDLSKQVISELLTDEDSEIAIARNFLQKKLSKLDLDHFEYKKKAYSSLKNRGFSHETIRRVIDESHSRE